MARRNSSAPSIDLEHTRLCVCKYLAGKDSPGCVSPADDVNVNDKGANSPATHIEADPRDPADIFCHRLNEILKEVVGRLEQLADEVLPDSKEEEPSSD